MHAERWGHSPVCSFHASDAGEGGGVGEDKMPWALANCYSIVRIWEQAVPGSEEMAPGNKVLWSAADREPWGREYERWLVELGEGEEG